MSVALLDGVLPDVFARCVEDIDLDQLASRGIEAILLDLDNTVCEWGSERISPHCEAWICRAKQQFRLAIVSNSIKPRRLRRVGERLGIPTVGRWGLGRKPLPGGILAALREVDVPPAAAAIVGDQLFADILGGNRLGLLTIWVKPLRPREFAGTKFARVLEALAVAQFRRRGLLPEDWSC